MNAPNGVIEWVEPLIQLATAGGFGALVWYLVVKHIPYIEERHRSERDEWRQLILRQSERSEAITREFVTTLTATKTELSQLRDLVRKLEARSS